MTGTDAAGNATTRQLFWTRCAPLPRSTWEPSGGVRVDGQKRFCLGLYGVHEPDFAEVSASEVVRDSLRLLRERDVQRQRILEELRADVLVGVE